MAERDSILDVRAGQCLIVACRLVFEELSGANDVHGCS
jgi:hypothetical protein